MKPTLVLLVGVVALVGGVGTVAAADATPQTGPGHGTTVVNNTTDVSPGHQLAGAVGAQGAAVEGELWNRTLTERLTNATTPDERAEVVADENDTLASHVDQLEAVERNLTEEWIDGDLSEGEYRASLSELVVRARTVELRANRTAEVAADLRPRVRERHGVNVTRIREIEDRARDLYRFESDVGRAVVNETLTNASDGSDRLPAPIGERNR